MDKVVITKKEFGALMDQARWADISDVPRCSRTVFTDLLNRLAAHHGYDSWLDALHDRELFK